MINYVGLSPLASPQNPLRTWLRSYTNTPKLGRLGNRLTDADRD